MIMQSLSINFLQKKEQMKAQESWGAAFLSPLHDSVSSGCKHLTRHVHKDSPMYLQNMIFSVGF